ncbi:MAG: alpha/beta fold hydrolase [Nanoarchaeota archaeon]|nr:alpha/beta fold hydrolase [Nanoarchaeota archaeon]
MEKMVKSFDRTIINYDITRKSGKFIVILHGLGGNLHAYDGFVKYLHDKKFSTIVMDLRGHGLSERPVSLEDYSLECFGRDVYEVIKKERIKEFILASHCFGSAVLAAFHKNYPNTAKAYILMTPFYSAPKIIERILNTTIMKKIIEDYKDKREEMPGKKLLLQKLNWEHNINVGAIIHDIKTTRPKSMLYTYKNLSDYEASYYFKKVLQKTLLIFGKKDIIVKENNKNKLSSLFLNCEVLVLPEGNHLLPLNQASKVSKRIIDFSKKVLV